MKFSEFTEIKPAKIEALKIRIKNLGFNLNLVEEKFIRGSGKGGQKINKTSNAVMLQYTPPSTEDSKGITVKCQKERKRSINRFLALRELIDRVEMKVSPETSAKLKEIEKIRKRKSTKKRKASKKR